MLNLSPTFSININHNLIHTWNLTLRDLITKKGENSPPKFLTDFKKHCGLQIGYVFWRVMHKTYMGHETRTKTVWETRFIQILGFPVWPKNLFKVVLSKYDFLKSARNQNLTPRYVFKNLLLPLLSASEMSLRWIILKCWICWLFVLQ